MLGKSLQERRLQVGSTRILMLRAIHPKNQPLLAFNLDPKHGVADEAKQAQLLGADTESRKRLAGHRAEHIQLAWSRQRCEFHQVRCSSSSFAV